MNQSSSSFPNNNFPSISTNQSSSSFPQMSAMVASPDLNLDSNWYLDSWATNHLTNNFNNLFTRSEYGGESQIYAANSSGLSILYYGSSSLMSSSSNRSFILNNLLRVPSIKKNLISVSQFAKDNNVFFEFHLEFCYVKDRIIGQMLL